MLTRTGIATYRRGELGLSGNEDAPVRVMRTRESVFHPSTLRSARGAPVTRGHPGPGRMVGPDSFRGAVIGSIAGEPETAADGMLSADILIGDSEAIRGLEEARDGEISIGYRFELEPAAAGAEYDFRTKGPLEINHVALVPPGAGRAGREVRVLDSAAAEDEEAGMASTEDIQKAVREALASQPPAQSANAPDVARAVTDAVAPIIEQMSKMREAQDAAAEAQKAAAARAEAEKAADKLVADTRAQERARYAILQDASPFLPEEKRADLLNAETKDILVAAVGDAIPNAAALDQATLHGVLLGMKAAAKAAPAPARPPGIAPGQFHTPTAAADARDAPRSEYIERMTAAYKAAPPKAKEG